MGPRPAAARGRTMQSETRLCSWRDPRLCSWAGARARAASGPVAGRVAPPCRRVTLAVCGLGAVHAADNKIGDDGARALAISLEKNRTLTRLDLGGARLCARWLGREGRGAVPRRTAAARGRAHDAVRDSRLQLGGARASGPVAGHVAPPCRRVTLAVCGLGAVHAADNKIGDDGARALAISLEKNRTLTRLDLEGARLCARWLGREGSGRARLALVQLGGAARARACGVGSPCRARCSSLSA